MREGLARDAGGDSLEVGCYCVDDGSAGEAEGEERGDGEVAEN